MKSKALRIALNTICLIALVALVLVLVALILVKREPAWFGDYGNDAPKSVVKASNIFTEKLLNLQDHSTRPKTMEITEEEINGYLRYGFESRDEWIPDTLRSPQVKLFREGVVLAARLRNKSPVDPVVCVVLEPVKVDGKLTCRVADVRVGGLGLPRESMKELIRRIEARSISLKHYDIEITDGAIRLTAVESSRSHE